MQNNILRVAALFMGCIFILSCSRKETADIIFINGNIQTVDEQLTTVEAMAVGGGVILAIGTNNSIQGKFKSSQVIDLKGKYVYPGFIDPHSHFIGYSMNLMHANLWQSSSMEEIVERLKAHHTRYEGYWLQGRGWDQNLFDVKEMPDNTLLNQAFPDAPVYIVRVDGHAAIANNKALQLAGITAASRVDGGEVRIKNGEPTGLLIDKAMTMVSAVIPSPSAEQKVGLLKQGQRDLFAVGLTSVCDAGLPKENILFIDSLQKAGELDIRVYAMVNPSKENFEYFLPKGPYSTEKLTVRSIKLFADGALGSRGALLKRPYSDAPNTIGLLVDDPALMHKACKLALENNFQVITHCIGDSAVSLMLDIYRQYLDPENDRRWRIEHAQVVDQVEFDKFGKHKIIPSIQAIHAVSDMGWAEKRVGADRIKGAYAYRDLMNQTGWLPNGSDFPVEEINPLYSFHAAFTRQDRNSFPAGGWYPQQLLTREEALMGMTIWAAKANFEEFTRGTIEPAKFADFVILDVDLLTIDPTLIYNIKVLETWLGGKKVYQSEK